MKKYRPRKIDNARTVSISPDPVSGFDRVVKILGNNHDFIVGRTILLCEVCFLDAEGNDLSKDVDGLNINGRFNPIQRNFTAFDEMVDPVTGDEVLPIWKDAEGNTVPEGDENAVSSTYEGTGAVKEYDRFCNIPPSALGLDANAGILAIMNAVYDDTIAKKDLEGFFN